MNKKHAARIRVLLAVLVIAGTASLTAACGAKQPFAGTVYVDYITPEDSIFDNEQDLEARVAALLRDAWDGAVDGIVPADAPDVGVNLRRRETFGSVRGEPEADAELVLAPRTDPGSGAVDFEALARDIALFDSVRNLFRQKDWSLSPIYRHQGIRRHLYHQRQ